MISLSPPTICNSAENLSTLPAVRLKNLARYAGMTSVFNIAEDVTAEKDGGSGCLCPCMETLALDDALDVLDAMLAVIIRDARKIGQKKRLRSLKDLDKSALALASACSYLLKEETPDESIRAEVFSYIPRQKLAEIITLVREIARPSDDNFHEEMVEQYGRVRRFLPHLLNTVKFSSAPAGVTTLNACDYLSREFSSRRQFFDDAPTEIISRSWKRLVINKEKHITRRGYTLCFLSKLQDSLRRRDVYVTGSNRWGDPRARLLQGADWQANRIKVYRSLGHPTDPQEAIKSLGHQLDSRYRQVAARLCENEAVELDVSGPKPRLTISPLASLDEPDSLKRLSKMISDLLPPVDLTELLLEINAHTGFADEFFHASEASARVDDLPVSISAVLMAEACNIGLEPLIRSNVPALTRHRLNWTKANYLRAETITSANADWLIFRQRCHWHRYGVEEKWHLQMECALLRQSEQSMPDRTANTLVITEGSLVQLCVRSVFRLSWHRYTGDAEGLYLCAGRSSGTGDRAESNRNYDRYSRCQRTCLWPFLAAGIPVFSTPG